MQIAHNSRSTGATGANSESSRSHLIMQIEIKAKIIINPINSKDILLKNRRSSYQSLQPKVVKAVSFID